MSDTDILGLACNDARSQHTTTIPDADRSDTAAHS